jgi:hypothetical protein
MSFQQLYYTSCEHGVGGYAGFQFNAVSQGVSAKVTREVEQLTVYELPTWDSAPGDAPVNLCHVRDAKRGGAITANVVYAGTDFSGRTGNYFAHALFTEDPELDFGGLLPVELWESPVWSRTVTDDTTLPTIREAPPRGSFDRPTVAAFLHTQDNVQIILARLLSAVDKAIDGGRSLVLWSPTSADNAKWIAAVSYLLEGARAREMSFFTYTRHPAQCRAHVIGTVSGAVTSPATLADGFRVFDMTSRALPDVKTHPLADLLARVGVLRAAGLWRQAAALGAGTERSFDEWYPLASAAAVLLGVEVLPSDAINAIVGWLPGAARRSAPLTAPHIETVLTVLLDRYDELSNDQLRPLLPLAKRAGAIGQLQRIEVILLNRAIPQLEHGRPPHGPTPVATVEGTQLAVSICERLLGSADATTILTVLDWARETGLNPDPQLIEPRARDVIGPALHAIGADRRVIVVGQAYPAFAHGLAAYLAASGPDTALRLLDGLAGELLDGSDLRRYPKLREMLLLEEVRSRRLPPVQALREVIELRSWSEPPLCDKFLLVRLWPYGLQTAGEAEQLLWLLDGDMRGTPALKLLDDALAPPHDISDLLAWLHLGAQTLAHPVGAQVPPATRLRLMALHGIGDMLDNAGHMVRQGDMSWYAGLHSRIEGLPGETRDLLREYLGYLTLAAPRPAEQLAACSGPVFNLTCVQARIRLNAAPPDHILAARLFQSIYALRGHAQRSQLLEATALAPTIPHWPPRDQGHVADILKKEGRHGRVRGLLLPGSRVRGERRFPDLSGDFKLWCKANARAAISAATAVPGRSAIARIGSWLRPGPELPSASTMAFIRSFAIFIYAVLAASVGVVIGVFACIGQSCGGYMIAVVKVFYTRPAGLPPRRYVFTPPDGGDPARPHYFYGPARSDLRYVRQIAGSRWSSAADWWQEAVYGLFSPDTAPLAFTAPLGAGLAAGLIIALPFAALLVAVIWLTHEIVVDVATFGVRSAATTLRGVDSGILFARHIKVRCVACWERMPYPAYLCPNPACKHTHWDIRPGRYGVLHRTCDCGRRMPTTLLLGTAGKLEAICPHRACQHPHEHYSPHFRRQGRGQDVAAVRNHQNAVPSQPTGHSHRRRRLRYRCADGRF